MGTHGGILKSMSQSAAPSASPGKWTWDEYVKLDEESRQELIDGQLVEGEVPTKWHEKICGLITYFLNGWALPRDAGTVLTSGYKVRVSERSGYLPDVQYFSKESYRKAPVGALSEGHPDLVVEIISPTSGSRDRVKKLHGYARIGTLEYWIIDPAQRTLERFVLENGRYFVAESLEGDGTFRPASFEGLEIPLATLWQAFVEATPD